jgi:outer membrane protein assembly factor BamB
VVGYAPTDGKILWTCDGIRGPKGDLAYSSPVIADDVCVCIGGYNGPGMAFKLGGAGDITASRLWRKESNPQSIGSGVVIDGYFYRPNADPGTIDCLEPATGKILWTDRAGGGVMWGSIVYAAGRCYVTNQKGSTVVFKPNPDKFELLANNNLGETTNSTPAISDGEIFLRTHQHLYCVAAP